MLSATCPSCGAPIWFRHAVAVATVCERCRSTVLRGDTDQLEAAGRASAFPRDLSPVTIGSHGKSGGRSFVVVGVIRKARERVRWNEWFVVFDDGKSGWLGEGNGQLQLFDRFVEVRGVPEHLQAGARIRIADLPWQVLECDRARIVAADGELPYAATDDMPAAYADLRRGDGATVGTLDHDFDPPRLYLGRLVTIKELGLDPIRPVSGWSDPDLQAAMSGPEIVGTRSLKCPACTAPLVLHTPDALSLVCGHCGSVIAVDDADPSGVVSKIGQNLDKWKPPIPLGARGRLEGVEWEVIGVTERFVRAEGVRYAWTEHFLFNPWHGYRWLAVDHTTGHWSLIERLPDLPDRASLRHARHAGHGYRAFQQGTAFVERVMGEFTWEVRAGDSAETVDYVDPPYMLSVETEHNEQSASLGKWLPADEVEDAFDGVRVRGARGIAPHQPNPYDTSATQVVFAAGAILFTVATVLLFVLQLVTSQNETLLDWSGSFTTSVQVSEVFTVPESGGRSLAVELASGLDAEDALVHLTLLDRTGGRTFHVNAGRTKGSTTLGTVPAGDYVLVVEGAVDPLLVTRPSGAVQVRVVRDPPRYGPVVFGFFVVMLAPLWWFGGRLMFENRRWANSDFA